MLAGVLFVGLLSFVGIVLIITGYLTRFRGYYTLIAGYDASRVSDPQGLARLVGGTVLALGFGFLLAAILGTAVPHYRRIVGIGIALAGVVAICRTVAGCSR